MEEYVSIETAWPGCIYWLSVESYGTYFKILVQVLDIRKDRAEVTPVAGDQTTFWVLTRLLYKRITGPTPSDRSVFASN